MLNVIASKFFKVRMWTKKRLPLCKAPKL